MAADPPPLDATPGALRDWYALVAIGALIPTLTLLTPVVFRTWGDNAYMAIAIPTGILAMSAAGLAERTPQRRTLVLAFAVAVALRLVLLFLEPLLSVDIYRYIWDGRIQAAGFNPFLHVPADPALSALRDESIFPRVDKANYAVTIYPPVAQLFFFLVTRASETVTAMKLAFLGCEAVTVFVVWSLLRHIGRPVTRIVGYLWLPLPMWEIANNGHVDALMTALMMVGILLAVRAYPMRGVAFVSLAALAKPTAALALAPLWRPWDWRMPALSIGLVALCYAPFLSAGKGVLGFLTGGYLLEESLVSGDQIWPLAVWRSLAGTWHGDAVAYWAIALATVGTMAFAASLRTARTPETVLADINRLLLVALLLLSPKYPWYFLVLTPFVALRGGATAWSVCIGAVLLQEETVWDEHIPILVRKSLLYCAIMAAAAFDLWRARTRQSGTERRQP